MWQRNILTLTLEMKWQPPVLKGLLAPITASVVGVMCCKILLWKDLLSVRLYYSGLTQHPSTSSTPAFGMVPSKRLM